MLIESAKDERNVELTIYLYAAFVGGSDGYFQTSLDMQVES